MHDSWGVSFPEGFTVWSGAVGTGDSDLFARAIGSDCYEESSVGEFLLGSRA